MWHKVVLGVVVSFVSINGQDFLNIPHDQLCASEPNLATCKQVQGGQARRKQQQGFIEQSGTVPSDDPFSQIATRAPMRSEDFGKSNHQSPYRSSRIHRPKSFREYLQQRDDFYREMDFRRKLSSGYYNLYPGLYPKERSYCETMKPNFAFTCQPGKSLRLDLVEFCKDYSAFCNIPNFHRIPGPREGPAADKTPGHVGVNVGFGFSLMWDRFPGMNDNVGVGVGLNLGLLGSKSPEAYRRGMDNPNDPGGGIVGVNGGVGVNAPGTGGIGVGSGVNVGK
ncbi:unnamed protein product, partial [Mesorhabditis belari]|uniref:Uncharacterized protein n=1 Tax=Mesorhabditis belari TaxID=2138241 RepID=A0AAF3J5J7_9BILA